MANMAASILAKLKNKAKGEGIPLQQLLNLFCQEEFIRRLSESKYKENLILKGGFLLYSISGFTTRPTIDADYLLKNYSNDLDAIERLTEEIISLPSKNDFIKFKIKGLELISEIREYHGIRVNLIGIIGRTKTPFNIDFGVGDIIVPSSVERTLPVLLPEFEKPKVLTYSLESTVTEKLDAIISLMEATGRMKDFYDIYYLATNFDFDGRKLQEAIYETLSNRGTPYEKDSIAIIARLTKDVEMQKRWDNFCKKILRYELNFDHVVNTIIEFTSPPYNAMIKEDEFFKEWSSKYRKYV
ncbi:MAG: nucleotidyl transferase AbiEii/AbiGii toxin family protein [Firmicutes bacterium]|nr:nucleotidyl transferase AbiEii/AbiGii toxin family protein [Bacillota bacterium]MDD3298394.1 nucleotidyl transferase AbiEii/AbiGii toxin family protein [Bacillota bacterium]MDD3850703.1 nucleotidyl transferase AbiEii/AbiGii toxin family protein [Bacillota bacterium]MDD4707906.1 nucleotidyl transferase AbiEii/AbiGii toxin family protein [Bacillota bacterium]